MPAWLELALDYRCNLRCLGCHACHDTGERLSQRQALEQLRAGLTRGMTSLWLGGGEPTLRDDLLALVKTARALGYERVLVQTNGMRLAYPAYRDALLAAGTTDLRFNVKSHRPEVHDRLSRGECHALLLQALAGLAGKDVRVAADVLVTRTTMPDLPALVPFFAERGVRQLWLWLLSAADDDDPRVAGEVPRIAELVPFLEQAADAARALGVELRSLHTPVCTLPPARRDLAWSAASLGLVVTGPDGRSFPLEASPFEGGVYLPGCDRCSARGTCGGARADYLRIHGPDELVPLD